MLIGEYQHSLDTKGRVMVPAKLRDDLGDQFILAKGLDGCLFAYSMDGWKQLDARIRESSMVESRAIARFLFASACPVELDKQGRILIPQNLRDYARLTKEVTIIGASVRAEIWDTAKWEQSCNALTSEDIEEAMKKLGF